MARKAADKVEVPDAATNRTSALLASATLMKMNQKWGNSVVFRATEDAVRQVHRIPTGAFPLDYALGGGWPAGRIHILYGHKSSAKTSTICRTIAEAQKICADCFTPKNEEGVCGCGTYREFVSAFIDVEGTFDHAWAQALGVDMSRVLFSRPEYAEQSIDILEVLLRTKECDLIALDSLAFLAPMKEIEESAEKDTMGLQPRIIGKSIRKFVSAMNFVKNETSRMPTVLFTNQIRNKVGLVFGSPEVMPGGLAPGFASTCEVRFNPVKIKMDEELGRPSEGEISFRVDKNKSSAPKMEGTFKFMLMQTEVKKKGEVYDEDALLEQAHRCGFVEGSGAHWKCLDEDYRAKSAIERRLLTEPAFKKRLRDATMEILVKL